MKRFAAIILCAAFIFGCSGFCRVSAEAERLNTGEVSIMSGGGGFINDEVYYATSDGTIRVNGDRYTEIYRKKVNSADGSRTYYTWCLESQKAYSDVGVMTPVKISDAIGSTVGGVTLTKENVQVLGLIHRFWFLNKDKYGLTEDGRYAITNGTMWDYLEETGVGGNTAGITGAVSSDLGTIYDSQNDYKEKVIAWAKAWASKSPRSITILNEWVFTSVDYPDSFQHTGIFSAQPGFSLRKEDASDSNDYSLKNAVYICGTDLEKIENAQVWTSSDGYKDAVSYAKELSSDGDIAAYVTTDADGNADFIKLEPVVYYVKEICPPDYYSPDPEVYSVNLGIDDGSEYDYDIYGGDIVVISKENSTPLLSTSAICENTGSQWADASGSCVIKDTVSYSGLPGNTVFTLKGVIVEKASGFAKGNEIAESEIEFTTDEDGKGTVEMELDLDASLYDGEDIVVGEYLYRDGTLICSHASTGDEDQTIHINSLKTKAIIDASGTNKYHAFGEVEISDKVECSNLIKGKEYVLQGTVADWETGEVLGSSEISFTPESSGRTSAEVHFSIPGEKLGGKTAVIFEKLLYKGNVIAEHMDLTDEDQTLYFPEPEIKTSAKYDHTDSDDESSEVIITDTVTYDGLIPGMTYKLHAALMDKDTGEKFVYNGEEFTEELSFTPENRSGEISVEFTLPMQALYGKEAVVFEELYFEGIMLASHADLEDADQTVDFPEESTETESETESESETETETETKTETETETETEAPETKLLPPDNIKTGDGTPLGLLIFCAAASASALFILFKKRVILHNK
ncbi:MAG: VaFE repeat-containing surface-anchored protein [Lachnospiraceae bacterium]|nr:VaFE repeat-containing surface-anchored protein [Lachnospiraceae bacterium]